MTDSMKTIGMNIASEVIRQCSEKYGFSFEEATRELEIEVRNKNNKEKKERKREKKVKAKYPLPFCGKQEDCCNALQKNQGLYTQCQSKSLNENGYCSPCANEMKKKNLSSPPYGTVDDRIKVSLMDYVDPSGKQVTPYSKIMKKLNLTEEEVTQEAEKFGLKIDEEHFAVTSEGKRGRPKTEKEEKEPKEKKQNTKGRPKKAKKVIELSDENDDLFATLVANAKSEIDEEEENNSEEEALKKAEDEAKKAAKKAEDEAKKAEKEAEKAAKKAEDEAKKAEKEAEKAAKKAEDEAKKAAKEAEKAAKKAEDEAKKAAKEAEKAAKIAEKEAKKTEKEGKKSEKEEEQQEQDRVKKIKYEGVTYLKSTLSGVIYNIEQEVVGKWCEKTEKIIFDEVENEEEEELSLIHISEPTRPY